ncbi:hypothetical protein ACLOJK_020477 [Asimina triloba]
MAFLLNAPPHFFLLYFFLFFSSSTSSDTLLPNHAIRDGETLVSAGKMFVLGFFSPGSSGSTNRYVGIWYYKDPEQTVVWVANRENPLANASGILTLVGGDLAILDETRRVVWLARNATTDAENTTTALLMDSGNLVLRDGGKGRTLWESFDHPTDTFLSGMKMGIDRNAGLDRFLSSWKSPDDPAAGEFSFRMDPQGQPQLMLWKGSSRVWRSGPWNGVRLSGVPQMNRHFINNQSYVSNENETYFMYNLYNASILSRMVLNGSGKLQRLTWLENAHRWNPFWSVPADRCDEYGQCGINGGCNAQHAPSCECLRGFQPRSPQNWYLSDGSDGCERRKALTCGKGSDGFLKVEHVKVPDTSRAVVEVDAHGGLKECEDACLRNCSCTAYSSADISGGGSGRGCVMWSGDLMDLQVYADGGQDIYVRVVASELGT